MMINNYSALFVFSVFLASVAQILLKISALKNHTNIKNEYINPYVMIAYSIFVLNTFLSIQAYAGLDIKQGGVLQTTNYIFVIVMSALILKEKITRRKLSGIIIILMGIVIFYS